jgi:hypothetical protein
MSGLGETRYPPRLRLFRKIPEVRHDVLNDGIAFRES